MSDMTETEKAARAIERTIQFNKVFGTTIDDGSWKTTLWQMNAISEISKAAIAALQSLGWQHVPPDYVVRPREPTEKQSSAGADALTGSDGYTTSDMESANNIYRAMIKGFIEMTDEEIETIASQYEQEVNSSVLALDKANKWPHFRETKTYIKALILSGWLPPDRAKAMRNEVLEECAEAAFSAIASQSTQDEGPRISRQWLMRTISKTKAAIRAMKETT